jgi:hypothetical protein
LLNQNAPARDVFRPDETVELLAETLSIQDEAVIWNAAKVPALPFSAGILAE